MNKLLFEVETKEVNGKKFHSISILIDGKNLIDELRTYETPFATSEGHPSLAGAYKGLPPGVLYNNITNPSESYYSTENKSDILDCVCGNAGCWPMTVQIINKERTVIWANFEQFHRAKESGSFWDYGSFGFFEFDKNEYLKELEKIKNSF